VSVVHQLIGFGIFLFLTGWLHLLCFQIQTDPNLGFFDIRDGVKGVCTKENPCSE
jgi:hypothetical protein